MLLRPRRGGILITASPKGEEEPGPEGAERGGYLPIPRCDARVGEWGAGDASAELVSAILIKLNSRPTADLAIGSAIGYQSQVLDCQRYFLKQRARRGA